MSADSLSRFAIALQSLLDAARNHPQTHQSEDDLARVQSLFAGVQLAAPPNITIPPFQSGIWPINHVNFGPASTDGGKTWQMWPSFNRIQHGNRTACHRWIIELQGVADAVFRQIELEAKLDEMNRLGREQVTPTQEQAELKQEPPRIYYITLDQAAALVGRSKRTLERYKRKMPSPAVEGGGGKPAEWIWSELRPWLEKEFNRLLPEIPPHTVGR
jgi:hypothetical protein